MRRTVFIVSYGLLSIPVAFAQGKPQPRPLQAPGTQAPGTQAPGTSATSEEKAAETRKWVEIGQQRQRAVDARNTKLWERWTLAICIGCGPLPVKYRVVYTTPARVLAGIPAADDDARRSSRL